MPSFDSSSSSLHSEAASECVEAGVPTTDAVEGEDVVLLWRSESLHAWRSASNETTCGRARCEFVHVGKRVFLRQASVHKNRGRNVLSNTVYEYEKASCTHDCMGPYRAALLTSQRRNES